jgi:hypothetical protein
VFFRVAIGGAADRGAGTLQVINKPVFRPVFNGKPLKLLSILKNGLFKLV